MVCKCLFLSMLKHLNWFCCTWIWHIREILVNFATRIIWQRCNQVILFVIKFRNFFLGILLIFSFIFKLNFFHFCDFWVKFGKNRRLKCWTGLSFDGFIQIWTQNAALEINSSVSCRWNSSQKKLNVRNFLIITIQKENWNFSF